MRLENSGSGLRGLAVFASGPHDDVCWRRLGLFCSFESFFAGGGFAEELHRCRCNATHVAASVGGNNAEQALSGFLGEVGLFEHALGGVDVWEV